VRVSVKIPHKVEAVMRVPEQEPLLYEQKGERVEFVLPKLAGHQMIALTFEKEVSP